MSRDLAQFLKRNRDVASSLIREKLEEEKGDPVFALCTVPSSAGAFRSVVSSSVGIYLLSLRQSVDLSVASTDCSSLIFVAWLGSG